MPPEHVAEPFVCTIRNDLCTNRSGAIWLHCTE